MSERVFETYGIIETIPVKKSTLDNTTKAGSVTVNAIIVENYEGNKFPKIVCGDVLVDVNAGYIGNDLIKFAGVLQFPFVLAWKKRDGKNVIA